MFKKKIIFVVVLLMVCLVSAQNLDRLIIFIGYDGQIPILASEVLDRGRPLLKHDNIYKFANGRLTNMNIDIPEATLCLLVKNGVYVFTDTIGNLTRYQFKLNGKELISQLTIVRGARYYGEVAINDKYFFVRYGCRNDSAKILKVNYRAPVKIDTIKLGFCGDFLLDATNDYLYYTEPTGEFFSGYVYQISIKNGIVKKIANVTYNWEEIAIVPHLNLIFSGNIKYPILEDYNKKQHIRSPDATSSGGIFYSYERNAFINYNATLDINEWECFYLGDGGKMPTELRLVPCFGRK